MFFFFLFSVSSMSHLSFQFPIFEMNHINVFLLTSYSSLLSLFYLFLICFHEIATPLNKLKFSCDFLFFFLDFSGLHGTSIALAEIFERLKTLANFVLQIA